MTKEVFKSQVQQTSKGSLGEYYDHVKATWVYPPVEGEPITFSQGTSLCEWCDRESNQKHADDCCKGKKMKLKPCDHCDRLWDQPHTGDCRYVALPKPVAKETPRVIPNDAVNHPSHYTGPVPGIECIEVTKHFSFLRGNAIKYLWRADYKGSKRQDLEKSLWYIQKELDTMDD